MTIKNESKETILSSHLVIAKTWKQKAFGLIIAKKGTSMLFKTRSGIHTFFMRYPIDVLVLDKENKVAALKHELKPNRIFLWNIKYTTIIEFQSGTLDKTNIGDKISLLHTT
jgi:uncharacterized membrane protein (UPF0127 family)